MITVGLGKMGRPRKEVAKEKARRKITSKVVRLEGAKGGLSVVGAAAGGGRAFLRGEALVTALNPTLRILHEWRVGDRVTKKDTGAIWQVRKVSGLVVWLRNPRLNSNLHEAYTVELLQKEGWEKIENSIS